MSEILRDANKFRGTKKKRFEPHANANCNKLYFLKVKPATHSLITTDLNIY